MKFEVGDRVKIIKGSSLSNCSWASSMDKYVGEEFVIDIIIKGDRAEYKAWYFMFEWLIPACETISKKETIMNTLSNIAKKLFDADTQVLVKAGYLESNMELSCKGKEALAAINLEANKAALVVLAQADLDEEAKKCK